MSIVINDIKSILGKGSGAGGAAASATGGGYTTTMNVRASVVNIIGGTGGNATTGAAPAVRTAAGAWGVHLHPSPSEALQAPRWPYQGPQRPRAGSHPPPAGWAASFSSAPVLPW